MEIAIHEEDIFNYYIEGSDHYLNQRYNNTTARGTFFINLLYRSEHNFFGEKIPAAILPLTFWMVDFLSPGGNYHNMSFGFIPITEEGERQLDKEADILKENQEICKWFKEDLDKIYAYVKPLSESLSKLREEYNK